MKNRKKIFIIIAVLSTFCFSICGCSKDKDKDISKKQLYASICNPNMQGVKEALKNHAELAKETIKRKTGARGLRGILEEILKDSMYSIPSEEGIAKCIVEEGGKIHIVKKQVEDIAC